MALGKRLKEGSEAPLASFLEIRVALQNRLETRAAPVGWLERQLRTTAPPKGNGQRSCETAYNRSGAAADQKSGEAVYHHIHSPAG
jgi:hypothetical protein